MASVSNRAKPRSLFTNQSACLGQRYREATDGANLDVAQSDMAVSADFTVPGATHRNSAVL